MLQVGAQIWTQTCRDLAACLPEEGVGLWSGQDLHVLSWTLLPNVAPRAEVQYEVAPQVWIHAWQEIVRRGETPLALVHSHPTAAAVPSAADRKQWHYPELWCVIVSFADAIPHWQAYRL